MILEEEESEVGSELYSIDRGNLYIHHDIPIPAFPLCLEWMNYNITQQDDTLVISLFFFYFFFFLRIVLCFVLFCFVFVCLFCFVFSYPPTS